MDGSERGTNRNVKENVICRFSAEYLFPKHSWLYRDNSLERDGSEHWQGFERRSGWEASLGALL